LAKGTPISAAARLRRGYGGRARRGHELRPWHGGSLYRGLRCL